MDNATSKTHRIARTIKDSNPRRGLSRKILKEKSRLTKLNTADAPRLLSPRLFSYALLQVKTTGIAAQHDGNPLILPILGRQNPENKNYLENFLKSLKKRLTKQHFRRRFITGNRLHKKRAETGIGFRNAKIIFKLSATKRTISCSSSGRQ